ncbi:Uncharacterised protein [Edwardsiella tarda]|nr:Uncharacterised protein [Edwardsiella tarda]
MCLDKPSPVTFNKMMWKLLHGKLATVVFFRLIATVFATVFLTVK